MRKLLLLSPTLFLLGCGAAAPIKEISNLTIEVAEYKLLLAEQQGGSWANTEATLEEARKLDAEGNHKQSLELARKARFESESALIQNQKNLNAAPWQF